MARNLINKEMNVNEIHSYLVNRLQMLGNKAVADRLGYLSASTMTHWKDPDGRLMEIARILFALDCKAVSQDSVMAEVDHLDTLFDFAAKGLAAEKERILGK